MIANVFGFYFLFVSQGFKKLATEPALEISHVSYWGGGGDQI
jgi:hypothetical protein